MANLKTFLKDVATISMRAVTRVITSLALVGVLLVFASPWWMPRMEKEVLSICKDYHATQTALESSKAWTLPSGQVIPPLIPMETPFK